MSPLFLRSSPGVEHTLDGPWPAVADAAEAVDAAVEEDSAASVDVVVEPAAELAVDVAALFAAAVAAFAVVPGVPWLEPLLVSKIRMVSCEAGLCWVQTPMQTCVFEASLTELQRQP